MLLTLLTYIIGSSCYLYISYMGLFGILNRTAINDPPQQI